MCSSDGMDILSQFTLKYYYYVRLETNLPKRFQINREIVTIHVSIDLFRFVKSLKISVCVEFLFSVFELAI